VRSDALRPRHHRQRALDERREAVCRNVVRLREGFARDALQEVAGDRFARREGDGVHQAVQAVPVLLQLLKQAAISASLVTSHGSAISEPNSRAIRRRGP